MCQRVTILRSDNRIQFRNDLYIVRINFLFQETTGPYSVYQKNVIQVWHVIVEFINLLF